MSFGVWTWGPKEPRIRWGPRSLPGQGLLGGGPRSDVAFFVKILWSLTLVVVVVSEISAGVGMID